MTETLEQYKKRVASAGGKAVWEGKSEEEKAKIMSGRRKLGIENKALREEESIKTSSTQ